VAGVEGYATTGVAIKGTASNAAGFGLDVSGRVKFSKVAGTATIANGTSTVTVTPGVDLVSTTAVLLTPRAPLSRLWVTIDTSANTFTIRTNAPVTSGVKVSWLVIG
jgi:hypothetical protein